MELIPEQKILDAGKVYSNFEGTKRYDCEKLDAFIDGAQFAQNEMPALFCE